MYSVQSEENKPKLFISHSTSGLQGDDRCVMIREALSLNLTEWDVFVDKKRINPGDKWRTEILYNLSYTKAGIILFNEKAALKSNWVTAEALILCFFKSINPDFQLIPVLFNDLKSDDTCFQQYEPFSLNEIQFTLDDPFLTPEQFVKQKIIPYLEPSIAKKSQDKKWVKNVFGLLEGKVGDSALVEAARVLELVIENRVLNSHEEQNLLLRTIVEFMHFNAPIDNVRAFRQLIISFKNNIDSLVRLLTAKWVENQSAEILLCAARPSSTSKFLTINTEVQDQIEQYLNRAKYEYSGNSNIWTISIEATSVEGDEAKVLEVHKRIYEAIFKRRKFFNINNVGESIDTVKKYLNKPDDVVICSLFPTYAKESILLELHKSYPQFIFLVQVRSNNELDKFKAVNAKPIMPLLDENKKDELFDLQIRLEAVIDENS